MTTSPAASISPSSVKVTRTHAVPAPTAGAYRMISVSYFNPPPVTLNELVNDRTGHFNDNYGADARSTHTLDWACIRHAESQNNYLQVSGAYGILTSAWYQFGETGFPGDASIATQDTFALRLFAVNGHKFSGSWNDACTLAGGLG